jgi:hypothetical protein
VALGIAPRVSCIASAILLYHLGPLEAVVWGGNPAQRGLELTTLALVVLAASPCADVWSVVRSRRSEPSTRMYRWPVLLVQLLVAFVYVFSAYGKLANAGLAWISGQNIREWLWLMSAWPGIGPFDGLGPFLASLPGVPTLIAVSAIVMEFSFPLAVASRIARRILVPFAALFHVGIVFALNLAYPNTLLLLTFVNWDWLRTRVRSLRSIAPAPAALSS